MVLGRSSFLRLLLIGTLLTVGACTVTPDDAKRSPGGADAGSYSQARDAYRAGDFFTAAERLIPLAANGDSRAQYALGYMYYYGKGVLADRERAVELFRSSAEQGSERARKALRMLNETATGPVSAMPEGPPPAERGEPGKGSAADPVKKNSLKDETAAPGAGRGEPAAERGAPAQTQPSPGSGESSKPEAVVPAEPGESQPASSVAASASPEPRPHSGEWMRERDPDHWTIQLVAGGRYDGVRAFVSRYRLQDHAAIVKGERDGYGSWYMVLYGVYSGLPEARAALDALPGDLRVNKPWIRRLGDALGSGG